MIEKEPRGLDLGYLQLSEFEIGEIFGESPELLSSDTDALKAYQEERYAQAEQGHPTFVVQGFFGVGFTAQYFVNGNHVADMLCDRRYFVDGDAEASPDLNPSAYTVLFTGDKEEVAQEMSLQRAVATLKGLGYPDLKKSA